ncbi:MAG: hypothetical protein AB9836_04690 [Aminipila sp.]
MSKYECIAFCVGCIAVLGVAIVTKSVEALWSILLLLFFLT